MSDPAMVGWAVVVAIVAFAIGLEAGGSTQEREVKRECEVAGRFVIGDHAYSCAPLQRS